MSKEAKMVFLDANAFIGCFEEQIEEMNFEVLNKIFEKLEENKMSLVLPENIKAETFYELEKGLSTTKARIRKKLKGTPEAQNEERWKKIIENTLKEAEDTALKKIQEKYDKIRGIVENIFSHKETINIPLSNSALTEGMRRSVLKTPPFTDPSRNPEKNEGAHTKDQDCIAFESILEYLKESKTKGQIFILCTNDIDFFNEKGGDLQGKIKEDLNPFFKNVKGYENPLILLKKEFEEDYSEEQVKEFEDLQVRGLSASTISATASIAPFGSIYNRLTPSHTEVCSKCGTLFVEKNDTFPWGISTRSYIFPEPALCSRCKEEGKDDLLKVDLSS